VEPFIKIRRRIEWGDEVVSAILLLLMILSLFESNGDVLNNLKENKMDLFGILKIEYCNIMNNKNCF
jgi:hypothetical protein